MKTRSDRIINLGVSLFIFGVGVVIGFAGLVASYFIHPAWVLGSSRIAEFSKNTGLANATQGLAAIGALVVGVPVSIGASMATIYVAHRSAKAAEQVERIERSRDRREIVQRLRSRAQVILKPYQDIAISLSKVDAASRDLIAVFIQSSPKLYNFHEQIWRYHDIGPIITRKFVTPTPETDSYSLELPPDVKKAAERLSTEILTLLSNVSAVVPDFESPEDSYSAASNLSQRFGRQFRVQFNALHFPVDGVSTQEENIYAEQSGFRSWRDLAAEIASQTSLESLIYRLDSLLVPCIFAPKTMLSASEVSVDFAVEGQLMPIWIPKLGIRHAATHWLECETTILGGIFWTAWKQDPSFYDLTAEEKSKVISETQGKMFDLSKYALDDEFDDLSSSIDDSDHPLCEGDLERDKLLNIARDWTGYQTLSDSTSRGSTLGASLLYIIASLLPCRRTIQIDLASEAEELSKHYWGARADKKTVEDWIAAATSECDDPCSTTVVKRWKAASVQPTIIHSHYDLLYPERIIFS